MYYIFHILRQIFYNLVIKNVQSQKMFKLRNRAIGR